MDNLSNKSYLYAIASLDFIARFHNLDIDFFSIIAKFGINHQELNLLNIFRIAKSAGFKISKKKVPLHNFSNKYPLPAICICKNDSFCVLLAVNVENSSVLIINPDNNRPKSIPFHFFNKMASGEFLFLKHKNGRSDYKFGFRWFYREILRFKHIILEVLLAAFVIQLFALVTPLFTQVILDKVLVHRSIPTLNVITFAFIFISLFELLLNFARNYIFLHTSNKIDAKLGAKIFNHLLNIYFVYFANRPVGNIVARIRELDRIREFITNKSVALIIDSLFSIIFISVLFLYSVKLTLIVLSLLSVIAAFYFFFTPLIRLLLQDKFRLAAIQNSFLVETINGIESVKALTLEGVLFKKWERKLAEYINANFKVALFGNLAASFSFFLHKILTIAILYIGVSQVLDNKLTIGQLIAFQMIAAQFCSPILRIVNLWNDFQQTILAVDRIGDILNSKKEDDRNGLFFPNINGNIKFEHLSFKYNVDDNPVLSDINLSIQKGMKVGVVGPSGCGKSTFAKLIQRFYFPSMGRIFIDDIDIRFINPYALRNQIVRVLQNNYLFSGSIKENILDANINANFNDMIMAAKISGAHEFISKLPLGYDTQVGERGSALSGGQIQKIAIARALIKNPKILILDEATAALDFHSEKILWDNLNSITKDRTTIIIAHRLATVKNCDTILFFDNGKILEQGSHDELIRMNGHYKHLFDSQLK